MFLKVYHLGCLIKKVKTNKEIRYPSLGRNNSLISLGMSALWARQRHFCLGKQSSQKLECLPRCPGLLLWLCQKSSSAASGLPVLKCSRVDSSSMWFLNYVLSVNIQYAWIVCVLFKKLLKCITYQACISLPCDISMWYVWLILQRSTTNVP